MGEAIKSRDLPGSILFTCTMNAVRSPIAEAYMKFLHGRRVFVDSAGVRASDIDGFAIAVMEEIGIDMKRHHAKTFDELHDSSFDIVVALSPEAQHKAVEMTRTMACEVEYWPTMDATAVEGTREQKLAAYRAVRDQIIARIHERFPPPLKPS